MGIAIDDDDVLFVCNCRGNTVSRVDPAGTVTTFAESDLFACPNGITFGEDDTLYVTNFNNHDIPSIGPTGEVAVFANVPGGAGNAHLAYAKGVFSITKIVSNRVVTVRTIDLVTITAVIEDALESGSLDDAIAAYHAYRADPVRGQENASAEVVALAYRFLSARDVPTAEALFRLNAESYPDDATAQYQLGELYRYTGRANDAVAQCRRALELDPAHRLAASRLAQLGAD